MPKIRTRRGAAKRFKLTGKGRLRHSRTGAGHMMTRKTRKRKRRLRQPDLVSRVDEVKVRRQLGLQ